MICSDDSCELKNIQSINNNSHETEIIENNIIPESDVIHGNTRNNHLVSSKQSKKDLKRQRIAEKWERIKILKKERKKEIKKEMKLKNEESLKNQARDTKVSIENNISKANTTEIIDRKLRRENEKTKFIEHCNNNFTTIIDCSWEDSHSEKTLKSLAQQILFCYGMNKRTTNPSKILLSGLGPLTVAHVNKNNINSWVGVEYTSKDYMDVIIDKELIYLTADAEETLYTLDKSHAYIIGKFQSLMFSII